MFLTKRHCKFHCYHATCIHKKSYKPFELDINSMLIKQLLDYDSVDFKMHEKNIREIFEELFNRNS